MDYEKWCGLSDEKLAKEDIAEINLTCAAELPERQGRTMVPDRPR